VSRRRDGRGASRRLAFGCPAGLRTDRRGDSDEHDSLDAFDTTLHKTNRWLNELSELAGWDSKQKAYLATRATLHALRDRITVDEVAQLGAQLPMLVRGFYYEGWDPSGKPVKERHVEQIPRPDRAGVPQRRPRRGRAHGPRRFSRC